MSRIAEQAFGDRPVEYPQAPGWKESTTSRDAAHNIAEGAPDLRQATYRAIASAGECGMTADEAAAACGRTVLAIRPRVTELRIEGSIIDTGLRRKNASGQSAKVWRAKK